jgi:predicted metal-dependent hydrolase
MIPKYKIIRESRKTLAIHVMPDSGVIVKSPTQATDDEVADFVHRKRAWLQKQLQYFAQFNKQKECDLISGSEIYYLGKQYRILVRKAQSPKESVEFAQTDLIIYSLFPAKKQRTRDIFDNWLVGQTQKQFVSALTRILKKFPDSKRPELKIRKLAKRWGSFLRPNTITLNPNLIIAPKQCIEYVIAHELCHYYHKDHSSAFYSLLGAKLPNWTKLKNRLETFSRHV